MAEDVDRQWRETGLRDAALAGDERAWQTLFDQSYAPLRATLDQRRAQGWADDIIQETWLTAARRLADFDPQRGSFQAWLQGIAWRVRADRQRKEAKHRGLPLDFDPSAAVDKNSDDSVETVEQTMRQLPEQYAQALQQRYLQGESVGQLARAMKLSYKGAESLLSRARQAFKAAFNRGDA